MKTVRAAILLLALALCVPAAGDIVAEVRAAADARNFTLAEREIQVYRASVGVTPEMLEALSWLARGALGARQYDRADGYATETRKLSEEMLHRASAAPVANALGASIEVHAQVLAARGQRLEATAFLQQQLADYRQTPIAPRIQKNINLLTLEGKPAPPLDVSHWLGPKPLPLTALRGHPVLIFFWAHWCGDCKAEVPILARLMESFASSGLVLVGPTQLYGYTAAGDATPEQELQFIDQVRTQPYLPLRAMSVPVSTTNFQRYGCSTTPTLVLLDRAGLVRLYHPGAMSYEELADATRRALAPRGPRP